jgi:SWI/SNF-related matrix-associated actin-dependent regulator 1 of chromatin subfamily A
MDHFGEIAVKLDGSTNVRDRQEAVDNFQNNDSIKLFIGNIKAAGVGITLTAASNTCFLELPWSPGDCDQAEDRVHRIGQEANSVGAYYLIANETIENDIIELLDEKRKTLTAVLDGKDVEDSSILAKLMQRVLKREKGEIR